MDSIRCWRVIRRAWKTYAALSKININRNMKSSYTIYSKVALEIFDKATRFCYVYSVCVCVCVRERERECVWTRERFCPFLHLSHLTIQEEIITLGHSRVGEREREWMYLCVCVCVYVCVCVCVCVRTCMSYFLPNQLFHIIIIILLKKNYYAVQF